MSLYEPVIVYTCRLQYISGAASLRAPITTPVGLEGQNLVAEGQAGVFASNNWLVTSAGRPPLRDRA